MLAFRAVLSAAFVSVLGASVCTSALGDSAPTFDATAAATLSFVFSTAGFASALGASTAFSPALVALSVVVLFATSSLA